MVMRSRDLQTAIWAASCLFMKQIVCTYSIQENHAAED